MLTRERTTAGLLREYQSFADLLATLDTSMWTCASRCTGWQVRDVAAHVVGQALDTVTGASGTRNADKQAASLRAQPPTGLAAQMRKIGEAMAELVAAFDDHIWARPSPLPRFTIGEAIHALLMDAYVHADDIRNAIKAPSDLGEGLDDSLDFVLGALRRDPIAAADSGLARLLALPAAAFPEESGIDAHEFLLAATGRHDPRTLGLRETVNIFRV
ncbi:maleylpyruvate isomerase family mycothiol-dependent enzyme [Mycolicibacter terrae]|uniref:Maleylpyruvate isomerase family mycothiol-dependent enzyme n=1 Tax=Mycolicibacter terrae TaxID=1788 RepID=A0ACD2ENG4_9MYCO|nr:maleylpyruvate isomerase family mycothiol-dependent enzyme [Mycolicibacter terrae]RRR45231.1 maleylpyruvate isomerase family mycothiol-dependent enzyme [Mycolicibacter terrae]